MFIVCDPSTPTGLSMHGPFPTRDAANEWAANNTDAGVVVALAATTDPTLHCDRCNAFVPEGAAWNLTSTGDEDYTAYLWAAAGRRSDDRLCQPCFDTVVASIAVTNGMRCACTSTSHCRECGQHQMLAQGLCPTCHAFGNGGMPIALAEPIRGEHDGIRYEVRSYEWSGEYGPMPTANLSLASSDPQAWLKDKEEYISRMSLTPTVGDGELRWSIEPIWEGDAPWGYDWSRLRAHLESVVKCHIDGWHLGCC